MKLKRVFAVVLSIIMLIGTFSVAIPAASAAKFTDTGNHWAKEAINKWSELGIVKGYPDGSFHPDANVTAAELCTIINRITDYTLDYTVASVPGNAWYKKDVSAMIARRALSVTSSSYEKPISREDAVVLICRAFNLPTYSGTFLKDTEQIADYARNYVSYMNNYGYISGYPDGTFQPQKRITRAEIVTILNKICGIIITEPGTYHVPGGSSYAAAGHVFVNSENVTLLLDGSHANIIVGKKVKNTASITVKMSDTAPEKCNENKILVSDKSVIDDKVNSQALSYREIDDRSEELATCPAVNTNANRFERAAVAMGSMLTYRNRHSTYHTLPTDFAHQSYTGEGKSLLNNDSWGIYSREDLLQTVISMTFSGHNAEFLSTADIMNSLSESEREALVEDDPVGYMVQETLDISKKWGDTGIISWDEFRMANLIQWGYSAGYISLEEAHALIEPALAVLAYYFNSWEEAYDNYLDGYAWWSRTDITNGKTRPRESDLQYMFVFYPDVFDDSLLTANYEKLEYEALYQKLYNEAFGGTITKA